MAAPFLKHRYKGVSVFPNVDFLIGYEEPCSLKYLYTLLHEWFVENGWGPKADHEFPEVMYLHKESPTTGKDVTVRWRLVKDPDPASNAFRWDVDLSFEVLNLKEVEFVHKDKKYKADKGIIEIKVFSFFVQNVDDWAQKLPSWLKPYNKWIFDKYFKKKNDKLQALLAMEMERLQDAIKTYLKIQTYLPLKEFGEFWAKRPPE
jgi:hypothetical protein